MRHPFFVSDGLNLIVLCLDIVNYVTPAFCDIPILKQMVCFYY